VEVADQRRERQTKQREANKAARISVADRKVQQTLPKPERDGRRDTINRIIKKLEGLSLAQLQDFERNIPNAQ